MPDRSEARSKPGTTDPRRWQHDRSAYPPEPCITAGCQRLRQVLGYCTSCASAALLNRGVLQRRTRTLLTLLGTNEDLTGPLKAQSWRAALENAIADCWDALEGTTTKVATDPQTSNETAGKLEARCGGCGVTLAAWEQERGTCVLCSKTEAA